MMKCDLCGKFCSIITSTFGIHEDHERGEKYFTDVVCKVCEETVPKPIMSEEVDEEGYSERDLILKEIGDWLYEMGKGSQQLNAKKNTEQ